MELIHKTIPFEIQEVNREDQTLWAVGSTEAFDRDGDIVRMSGWELTNYLHNPVILWAHQYREPPIGKALQVEPQPNGLWFHVQFARTEFAQEVFNLYADGFMRAWSVGFLPKEKERLTNETGEDIGGWEFQRQELLELSAVPVPANPQALNVLTAKGVYDDMTPAAVAEMILLQKDWDSTDDIRYTSSGTGEPDIRYFHPLDYEKLLARQWAIIEDNLELCDAEKPYANEHACRLKDPAQYDACRRGDRTAREPESVRGKLYHVIYCKKGDGPMEQQAFRYPTATWTEAQGKAHCDYNKGAFEPATGEEVEEPDPPLESEGDEQSVGLEPSNDTVDDGERMVEETLPDDITETLREAVRGLRKEFTDE